ncbi:hypothetical protein GN244_ATG15317 [Phytophthora infestans]|uniref:Uncharacterized protein n=1 Tax=Phytophthora infestans TaxID=4787 RepID=A0A833SDB6_PHYIN|nr:hypothetical protein GN244_ATG15317 [Phytophthora infestans]KAF4146181.1 hypothetical protein GN958_ATG04656 [Phytophthora infestans]
MMEIDDDFEENQTKAALDDRNSLDLCSGGDAQKTFLLCCLCDIRTKPQSFSSAKVTHYITN